MLVKKENYNKKVSPFSYDYLNDIVIPVDVKISVAVMDILREGSSNSDTSNDQPRQILWMVSVSSNLQNY